MPNASRLFAVTLSVVFLMQASPVFAQIDNSNPLLRSTGDITRFQSLFWSFLSFIQVMSGGYGIWSIVKVAKRWQDMDERAGTATWSVFVGVSLSFGAVIIAAYIKNGLENV